MWHGGALHLLEVVLVVEDLDVTTPRLVSHVGQRADLTCHLFLEVHLVVVNLQVVVRRIHRYNLLCLGQTQFQPQKNKYIDLKKLLKL